MVDYAEKRDFQRMVMDCSFEYQVSGEQQALQGTVKNLSAKGVLFLAVAPLAISTDIRMTLTPHHDITPPMSANVKIIRCDAADGGEYLIAGEILQIL